MTAYEQKLRDAMHLCSTIDNLLGEVDYQTATVTMLSLVVQGAVRGSITKQQFLEDISQYWDKYTEVVDAD